MKQNTHLLAQVAISPARGGSSFRREVGAGPAREP